MTELDLDKLSYWQGQTDQRVGDAERRLDAINGSIREHARAVSELAQSLGDFRGDVREFRAAVRTWGAVLGGIAAVVSPVLTGVAVYFITH